MRALAVAICVLLSSLDVFARELAAVARTVRATESVPRRTCRFSWTTTENIAWKLPMPAWSGSTPIVWGDRIFLNVAENGSLFLWAVDRAKGEPVWKRHLSDGDNRQRKQNMSTPSPVTDGTTVWVHDGHRHPEGVRLRRQRAVDARHPEGIRAVRASVGLWLVAHAASGIRCSCRCCTA